jgi:c-di-GMP-related signal transduction protein
MNAVVARQAIFDCQRNLYGYELLFRSNASIDAFDGTEAAVATMQVLANTLMSIGTEALLCGKKAFVNFDYHLLLADMHLTMPKESLVIEILESVAPTSDLVALCESIRQHGYSFALDDFTDEPGLAPMTRIASVIKVDMRLSSREEQERMLGKYKPRGVLMLAEKVESHSEYQWALRAGYDLFQGYFFALPEVIRSQRIPAVKTSCLRLLRETHQAGMNFQRIGQLIREDVSLTYQLLRYTNSAAFPRHRDVQSITNALLTLGEGGLRSWVALATLPLLVTDKPHELLKLSLVRARFCEELDGAAQIGRPNEAFLMGMFSLLDALIDRPLEEALHSIDLGNEIRQALLGTGPDRGFLTCLYRLICCYERGNWDEVEQLSQRCGIPGEAIGKAYLDATAWAENLLRSIKG